MRKLLNYIYLQITIPLLLAVVLTCAYSSPALSQAVTSNEALKNCAPATVGGNLSKQCPDGKITRNDIEVGCIEKQHQGGCLNIMPTTNVSRIPEDMCFRGLGWSKKRSHKGIDYASPTGTNVTAAADGIIDEVNNCSTGGGKMIKMRHAVGNQAKSAADMNKLTKKDTYQTVYMHLSEITATNKSWVAKGTVIGKVGGSSCGASGYQPNAYGAHLHLEIRDGNGSMLDPMCSDLQGLCGGNKMDMGSCYKDCNDPANNCTPSTVTNVFAGDSVTASAGKGCNIETYKASFTGCFFCDMFTVLFNTASEIAGKAFSAFASSIQKVVVIAMALWIAFKVMMLVSSMEMKEPRAFIKELLNQSFIVLIIFLLLSLDLQRFMDMLLTPIFNTGFKLANIAMHGPACTNEFGIIENGGLPASMGISIVCTIKNIQDELLKVITLGSMAMCLGFWQEALIPIIIPHFGFAITGILLWICGGLMLIIYPFLLVDSILKLCVASALMPAAIGCYAFKVTRNYTMKVFETYLNAMLVFVFLSIIVFLMLAQINQIVEPIINAVEGNYHDSFLQQLSWSGQAVLKMVFIILLGWAVLGEASKFAKDFAGGMQVGGIGENIGGLAVNTGHSFAKFGGKRLASATKGARQGLANTIKEKANNVRSGISALAAKKFGTKNADGSYTLNTRNIRGRKVSRTVSISPTGQKVVNKTVTTAGGREIRNVQNDGYIKVTTKTNRNGTKSVKTEMVTSAGKSLTNKDGSLHTVALNNIMQNSTLPDDIKNMAVMNQLVKENMPGMENLDNTYASRNISSKIDANGNRIFTVEQTNVDGTKTNFTMQTDAGNNKFYVEVDEIHKDRQGNEIHEVSGTNGVVNKTTRHIVQPDGTITRDHGEQKFSFTEYHTRFEKRPLDALGTYAATISQEKAEFGFSNFDVTRMKANFAQNPRNQSLYGFR